MENRKLEKIMTQQDALVNPEVIYTEVNLAFESQKEKENNYTENSNLLKAINSATEKYLKSPGSPYPKKPPEKNYAKEKSVKKARLPSRAKYAQSKVSLHDLKPCRPHRGIKPVLTMQVVGTVP